MRAFNFRTSCKKLRSHFDVTIIEMKQLWLLCVRSAITFREMSATDYTVL